MSKYPRGVVLELEIILGRGNELVAGTERGTDVKVSYVFGTKAPPPSTMVDDNLHIKC
jgi:hypothetical protein